jgi:Xaa-Pro aminopeptidase
MFAGEIYSQRRAELKKRLQGGIALFLGNEESPMNYLDNTYPFRQDSTFLYFFGLDTAGMAALIDLDGDRDMIFGNDLTIDDIVWMGTQPTVREKAARAGVSDTRPLSQLADYVSAARQKGRRVHFLPPYRAEQQLQLWKLLDIPPAEQARTASVEMIVAASELRIVKSDEEIAEIEQAVSVSTDMHVAAMRMVRPGLSEARVAARVTEIALAAGGNLGFPVIATINGQTLHNHYHGNTLRSGQLFLLDCGAETASGYCGDLSSTFPVSKKFTPRQREIYEVTQAAHKAAVAALTPGLNFREVHLAACRKIAAGLKYLGLMKGDVDEAVAAGAHAMFFPCGTGHLMGLDVHDMENMGEVHFGYQGRPKSTQFGLKSLRLARPLQPGFVLTIEPGIYFIPELIDRWRSEGKFTEFIDYDRLETYKDFSGIRNEENFLITADGARRLGKKKPQTITEVEAERKRGAANPAK